jgi:NitT/TauT family transport system permease protein
MAATTETAETTETFETAETVESAETAAPAATEPAPESGLELAALDALDAGGVDPTSAGGTRRWRRVPRAAIPPAIAVVLIIVVWQLLYLAKVKPTYDLPAPLDVWRELFANWSRWQVWQSIENSVWRGMVGFAIAVAIGTPLGIVVGRVKVIRASIGPILSGLQNLPSIAWVPPAIILYGITNTTIIVVILLGAVPSVSIGLTSGLDQVPPLYLRVGRNIGARGLRSVWHVLLPAAMPGYVAGLKQGWAFAWRSLMAAELIAISPSLGPGLGQLLEQGRENLDVSQEIAAIVLILLVGIAINALIFAPLERHVLRSRGLTGTAR